jgi:hypothetical protein
MMAQHDCEMNLMVCYFLVMYAIEIGDYDRVQFHLKTALLDLAKDRDP